MVFAFCLVAVPVAAQSPADSVQIVTRDIPNFWRAYDLSAGKDSVERVRIFRTVYVAPGSPGLRDWVRERLMNRETVRSRLVLAGWRSGQLDSLPRDSLDKVDAPFAEQSAAEALVAALALYPRYFAAVRANTLAVDTSSAIKQGIHHGLDKLAKLYPEARFRDVYFLIGNLYTGGTTGRSGMLIGTEQYASGPDTPRGELPAWAQAATSVNDFRAIVGLVVHETVHTLQKPKPSGQGSTLLRDVLGEGIPDFLTELAIGPRVVSTPREIYGRAHEHEVWVDFQDEMESDSTTKTWMYNGMVPPDKNHGAVDIGYWVGYRIASAYYARTSDKRAAVRDLLELKDPEAILRASGYAP
jgi:hypothetical protein